MFKTMTLLARRPDLTREEFVRRYEEGHARLGERLLRGTATRYVRRYLVPEPGAGRPDDHDVAMEIWYPDRATYEATIARLGQPEVQAEIVADEETLFDRARHRFFILDERESVMEASGLDIRSEEA